MHSADASDRPFVAPKLASIKAPVNIARSRLRSVEADAGGVCIVKKGESAQIAPIRRWLGERAKIRTFAAVRGRSLLREKRAPGHEVAELRAARAGGVNLEGG